MNKFLTTILIAAILLTTACSDNNTSATSSQNNSTSSTDNSSQTSQNIITEAPAENTPNNLNDTLPQCEPANTVNFFTHNVMKGINGYYYYDFWETGYGDMSSGIVYYDIPTGKTIPLCSKPQCPHDGNAFCPSTSFDSHFNILYNG